jgi:hypothetical protein
LKFESRLKYAKTTIESLLSNPSVTINKNIQSDEAEEEIDNIERGTTTTTTTTPTLRPSLSHESLN